MSSPLDTKDNTDFANFRRLSLFLAVAESLNFSEAARHLQVSQPAVSQQIKELENIVGVPLFYRVGHRVALTEPGHALLSEASRLKEAVVAMERKMRDLADRRAGVLKLAATSVWAYLLPRHMAQFRDLHPETEVNLSVAGTKQVMEMLLEGRVHLGFTTVEPGKRALEAVSVAEDELVVFASSRHHLADGRTHPPSELNGEALVARADEIDSRYLESIGVETLVVMRLDSHESMKQAVQDGIGVSLISRYAITSELASGRLAEIHLDAPPCRRHLYVLRTRALPLSEKQQAFVAHILDGMAPPRQER